MDSDTQCVDRGNIDDMLRLFLEKLGKLDVPAWWNEAFNGPGESPDKASAIQTEAEGIFGAYPSIDKIEDILSYFKAKRARIIEDDIPTFLAENGLKKVIAEDGTEVSTEEIITTKTVDEAKMLAWIIENGGADLIKDSLSFGKGICDDRLVAWLAEHGYTYSRDSGVHSQTLKKFITDRYKDMGTEGLPPADAVEARPLVRAKIKAPKN